ncbi:MAG: trypsin-like peptidase domain-containing protein [Gemmatimonadota bacterium]|nr:trypsin-like peptidase domain-containing protein [Gemmatimonadota bacterium]
MAEILSDAFANAAKAIRPSVVRLDVEMKRARGEMAQAPRPRGPAPPPGMEDFFERFFDFGFGDGMLPPPGPERGTGSGVVIDADGHIVTNSHVVRGASRVMIAFSDGQKYAGKVVGSDPYTDVAVVRFEKKPETLTVARLGNSDELRVGPEGDAPAAASARRACTHRPRAGRADGWCWAYLARTADPEFTHGLSPLLEAVRTTIWIPFILNFAVEIILAGVSSNTSSAAR